MSMKMAILKQVVVIFHLYFQIGPTNCLKNIPKSNGT